MRRQEQELLRSNEDFFERMRQTLEQESSLMIQMWWRDILARKRARQIALLMERVLDDAARKIQAQMRKKMERRMTTKGKQRERKRVRSTLFEPAWVGGKVDVMGVALRVRSMRRCGEWGVKQGGREGGREWGGLREGD